MKDELNCFSNGKMEDNLNFFQTEGDLKFFSNVSDLKFSKLKTTSFSNGRQSFFSIVRLSAYCHNPTNNLKQPKTTFVGVVLLSVRKNHTKPHQTTPCDYISSSSMQPRKLIFGMQPYYNTTRLNMENDLNFFVKWKTTLIFLEMENDLNIFENGRRPQFFQNRKQPQFIKLNQIKCNLKLLKLKQWLWHRSG
jgi:hypothetical protein